MDELDALLGDLGKGLATPASQPPQQNANVAMRPSIVAGRSVPAAQPQVALRSNPSTAGGVAGAPGRARATSGLEDLDSLITQLGGSGGSGSATGSKPATTAAASPASTSSAAATRSGSFTKADVSDIDALMATLSTGSGPSPVANSRPSVAGGRVSGDNTLRSDIDALMASLGGNPSSGSGGGGGGGSTNSPGPVRVSPNSPATGRQPGMDTMIRSLQVDSRTTPASPGGVGSSAGGGMLPQQQQRPGMGLGGSGSGGGMPPAVQNTPKGTCVTCQRIIQGPMMQALGGTYHPNCFVCANCGDSLVSGSFYQTDNRPTCARCYQAQFCARCGHCNQPIQGQCISALNRQWHVNCFICAQCLKPFGTSAYFERDGNPFCESCLYGIFSSRCGACDQPIKADTVNACGKQWHPECFVCAHCRRAFAGQPYFEYGGRPYCQLHYHSQIGATCGCGCGRSIMGRVVQALGRQWLPEHFLCGFCMNSLAGQNFTQRDNKAYCNGCFGKLFAA